MMPRCDQSSQAATGMSRKPSLPQINPHFFKYTNILNIKRFDEYEMQMNDHIYKKTSWGRGKTLLSLTQMDIHKERRKTNGLLWHVQQDDVGCRTTKCYRDTALDEPFASVRWQSDCLSYSIVCTSVYHQNTATVYSIKQRSDANYRSTDMIKTDRRIKSRKTNHVGSSCRRL